MERMKIVTLFKVPPETENEEIRNYLSCYGEVMGAIRNQKNKCEDRDGIQNGNRTIRMKISKRKLGSINWFGGSKVEAFYSGIERIL